METRGTDPKVVTTSAVGLAPAAWGEVVCRLVPPGAGVPVGCLKMLSKEAGAAVLATAIQANSTWLVSRATTILNVCTKSIPRMRPATATPGPFAEVFY